MARSIKAHILLVLVTFAWGATFVSVKDALGNVSPLVFNALRMAIASVTLIVIFFGQLKHLNKGVVLGGALLGVWLWLGYSCQTVGLEMTTASKSAFITGLAVVLVPLIVAVSGRRVPNRWTLVGVVCAFVGLYLMTIPSRISVNHPTQAKSGLEWGTIGSFVSGINLGDLITLGCAVAYAAHIYTMGRLMQRYPFKPIAVMQIVTATLLMAITVPLGPVRMVLTGEAVFAILFTALICTAAAFSIQAWAQQFTPPTHTALIFALEPVFAALASRVLLGEHLGVRGTVGALLILSGILVSELKGSSVDNPENRPFPKDGKDRAPEFSIN